MTNEETIVQLNKNIDRLLDALGSIVESRDMEGQGHIKRVRGFTFILANELMKRYPEYGLDSRKVSMISSASALHDMGKITISDDILFKPGRLTKEEFDIMKTHTILGCELLEKMKGAWDEEFHQIAIDICRFHHEKYDGMGYPKKLVGDDIPLAAQIVSIVDIYDALVCVKVYKDAFTPEQAYRMIVGGECGVFNPKLIDSFEHCADQFARLAKMSRDVEGGKA